MGVHVVVDIFINFVFGSTMFMVCVKPIIAMTIFIFGIIDGIVFPFKVVLMLFRHAFLIIRYFLLKPSWFNEINFWTYCHSIAFLYHLNMFLPQMGCYILHFVSFVVQDSPPLAFRTPMFTNFGMWSNYNESFEFFSLGHTFGW